MNTRDDDLLNDVLDDDIAGFRDASLNRALTELRRRKKRSRATRRIVALGCLASALLLAGVLAGRFEPEPAAQRAFIPPQTPTPGNDRAPVKVISDEELFALFPNQSVALVGTPGRQKLVILDSSSRSDSL